MRICGGIRGRMLRILRSSRSLLFSGPRNVSDWVSQKEHDTRRRLTGRSSRSLEGFEYRQGASCPSPCSVGGRQGSLTGRQKKKLRVPARVDSRSWSGRRHRAETRPNDRSWAGADVATQRNGRQVRRMSGAARRSLCCIPSLYPSCRAKISTGERTHWQRLSPCCPALPSFRVVPFSQPEALRSTLGFSLPLLAC